MILTPEIIKSFEPCLEGYKRFLELLPNGGTLEQCIDALAKDGRNDWGFGCLIDVGSSMNTDR